MLIGRSKCLCVEDVDNVYIRSTHIFLFIRQESFLSICGISGGWNGIFGCLRLKMMGTVPTKKKIITQSEVPPKKIKLKQENDIVPNYLKRIMDLIVLSSSKGSALQIKGLTI